MFNWNSKCWPKQKSFLIQKSLSSRLSAVLNCAGWIKINWVKYLITKYIPFRCCWRTWWTSSLVEFLELFRHSTPPCFTFWTSRRNCIIRLSGWFSSFINLNAQALSISVLHLVVQIILTGDCPVGDRFRLDIEVFPFLVDGCGDKWLPCTWKVVEAGKDCGTACCLLPVWS